MKVSGNSKSPCFRSDIIGKTLVFLDGTEIRHVHTADEEGGCVWIYDLDPSGKQYLGFCGHPVIVRRYGTVEIRPKEGVALIEGEFRWKTR